MCLTSSPIGNIGGYSYLYIVDEEKDEINMSEYAKKLLEKN